MRPPRLKRVQAGAYGQLNLEHGYAARDAVLASLRHLISEETRMNDLYLFGPRQADLGTGPGRSP